MKTRLLIIIIALAAVTAVLSWTLLTDDYVSPPLLLTQMPQSEQLLISSSFVKMQPDEIVQQLTSITNDLNVKKRLDNTRTSAYITEKGDIRIGKVETYSYSRFVDYGLYGKENAIPKSQAETFVASFLKEIGYEIDGSEWMDSTDFGSRKEIVIKQQKDGWIIENEIHRFNFQDDRTLIQLGRWYPDLDSFEIKYSQDDAKQIAYDFIQNKINSNQKLREMNLETFYPEYVQMKIIQSHLVYAISGIYPHIEVQVDTHTGEIVNANVIKITEKEVWGCASVGVKKLTLQDIEKRTGTLLYYEIVDDDLKQLPVLKEMIDATNSRIEYNKLVLLPISIDEWNGYDEFFKGKFVEQHEDYYESDLRNSLVLYDGKIYEVRYNENYKDAPLWVELHSFNISYDHKTTIISNSDLVSYAPKVKEAIGMMNTWEVSIRNNTAILESEQNRYNDYLHQKNLEKFGDDAEQYANIFYYNGNYYEPEFVIC